MSSLSDLQARLIQSFNRNEWQRVLQLATELQPRAPGDAVAPFMAGVAYMQLQQLPQAVEALQKAAQLEPGRADFAAQYAKALELTRRTQEAKQEADRALTLEPADPMTLDTLGVVYSQAHAHEQAVAVFRRLVAVAPNHPQARFNLAYALTAVGDVDAAEQELENCIRLNAGYWMAHLRLAQIRKQTAERNHIEQLRALLARYANNADARLYLHMALAKEHDDLGDHEAAFEHYRLGKSVGRERRVKSAQRDAEIFERLQRSFSVVPASNGDPDDAPIFIIGMPRTGTTLMDRILSSHPDVYSAGELQAFPATLQHVYGGELPILLDAALPMRTRDIDWGKLGACYLEATRSHANHAKHFIDKMPHNFLYAGFIANALPNAKIICLRRHPLDTCLSNFRHLFEQQSSYYDYAFDLLDTGRYYIGFHHLMMHWRRVFPGRILEICYEALVNTQEEVVHQLLAFCGLPWHDACLQSERNAAPVNTPNAWQVRAPVYRHAVKRWKQYESQLGELRALLQNAGVMIE